MKGGKLEVIIGPMYSSKSSKLLSFIRQYKILNKKIMVINHKCDTRYGTEQIITHDKISYNALSLEDINEVFSNDDFYDSVAIFIEEGQFFQGLYDVVNKMVNKFDKHVFVAGLDGDYRKEPFGDMIRLIPEADEVYKQKALCLLCGDGTPAIFTMRIVDNNDTILVGAQNEHISVCRYHYNKNTT